MAFKVGDRVKIAARGEEYFGSVGTIREITPADKERGLLPGAIVAIRHPDNRGESWVAMRRSALRRV